MKPGRRAFFLPRMLSDTPWTAFCQRLARQAKGAVSDETAAPGTPGRARLAAAREEDVYHARALCAEFGVLLVPSATPEQALPADRQWLLLDETAMDAIESFDERHGIAVVQAGCTMASLRARLAGSAWQWHEGADAEPIGRWLQRTHGWLPGRCADSGLDAAQVMLAGGAFEQLGPFGADSTQPLRSAAGSRLVPELFQLSADPAVAGLMAQPAWSGGYRIDAMVPHAPAPERDAVPNPAHLLLGSAGALAWPVRLRLRLRAAGTPVPLRDAREREGAGSGRETPADRLDAYIKAAFDPGGVFPSPVV
ncbi:hypothetical protein PIGHUM_02677 [Pigmentiphaga humi]|uniref:Uncharacterized protein n=1 Tax=Pigmentiphaga humi TaxID=2478468 RepID=A0A3P4B3U8_9BURK|nr:FAD-binding protein [Pigmentiphaga humi]VCU70601.1 hypothetical protein PIGHUM_02677 [Pigmentiphaga humi]